MDTVTVSEAEFQSMAERSIRELVSIQSSRFEHDGYSAKIASPEMLLCVTYDATRSFELNIRLSEVDQSDPPFELADILRVTDCPASEVARSELMQTANAEVVSRLMDRALRLLDGYGRALLAGDSLAFEVARSLRSARAKKYTEAVRTAPAREAAEIAWQGGDLARVHALLSPIADLLGERDLRRLAIAAKANMSPN